MPAVRKNKLAGLALLMGGVGLATAGVFSRRKAPGIYAQAFPTKNGQRVEAETEALITALRSHGLRVKTDWPSQFTFGRGGPAIPQEVVGPALLGIGFFLGSYAQGFVGQIGAEHSIAIRKTIKEWLGRRGSDEFYLAIETASGQQVRARIRHPGSFTEAYDALDDALRQLPVLPPGGFCMIEWDDSEHRWVQPL